MIRLVVLGLYTWLLVVAASASFGTDGICLPEINISTATIPSVDGKDKKLPASAVNSFPAFYIDTENWPVAEQHIQWLPRLVPHQYTIRAPPTTL